jgi:hypothetical protein
MKYKITNFFLMISLIFPLQGVIVKNVSSQKVNITIYCVSKPVQKAVLKFTKSFLILMPGDSVPIEEPALSQIKINAGGTYEWVFNRLGPKSIIWCIDDQRMQFDAFEFDAIRNTYA